MQLRQWTALNHKVKAVFMSRNEADDQCKQGKQAWPHSTCAGVPSETSYLHQVVSVLQLALQTLICVLVARPRVPDDVSHCRILSPDKTEWQLISATLCGWRCCFVANQLWLMKCIREEEEACLQSLSGVLYKPSYGLASPQGKLGGTHA